MAIVSTPPPVTANQASPVKSSSAPPPIKIRPASRFGTVGRMAVLAALVLLVILYLVTKLGLFAIPFLSVLYQGPVPTRVVHAAPLAWDDFQTILAGRINQQSDSEADTYRLDLSEEELTGVLEASVGTALREQTWKMPVAQVVVTPEHLELLLKLQWGWHGNLDLLLGFVPKVDEQGALHFEIKSAQIGDYGIPAAWGLQLGSFIFSRDLGAWEIRLGEKNAVRSVGLKSGIFTVLLNK
jgi:hypothetical protein